MGPRQSQAVHAGGRDPGCGHRSTPGPVARAVRLSRVLGRQGSAVLQRGAGAAEGLDVPGRRGREHRGCPMVPGHAVPGLHGRVRLSGQCAPGRDLQLVEPSQRGPRLVLGERAPQRARRRSVVRQPPLHHRLGPVERVALVPRLRRRRPAERRAALPDAGPGAEGVRPVAVDVLQWGRRPPRPARYVLDALHARVGEPAPGVGLRLPRPLELLSRRSLLPPLKSAVAARTGNRGQHVSANHLAVRREGADEHGEPLEGQRVHASGPVQVRGRGRRAGAGDRLGPRADRLDVETEPRRPPRPGRLGGL